MGILRTNMALSIVNNAIFTSIFIFRLFWDVNFTAQSKSSKNICDGERTILNSFVDTSSQIIHQRSFSHRLRPVGKVQPQFVAHSCDTLTALLLLLLRLQQARVRALGEWYK